MTNLPMDQFTLLCCQLSGLEVPPPPAIPGRVHAERDQAPRLDELPQLSPAELADLVGITEAAAGRRIEGARQSGTWTSLLDRSTAHERKRIRPTATAAKRRAPKTVKKTVKKTSEPTARPLPRSQGAS